MRNRKLLHDYNISISVVYESEDIEEVEVYADALMAVIQDNDDVAAADWYNITPIRKCRPKRSKDED